MECDLKNICAFLKDFLQIDLFQDMAYNGLQVEGKKQVVNIATAVSASLSVIKKAVDLKVDLLLVHHGLILKGKEAPITLAMKEKLKLLLHHEINLLAYHLPVDAHQECGNNWAAAAALGWQNLQPFGTFLGKQIGVKGEFLRMSREQFREQLEDFYGHPAHLAPGGHEEVSSAALVSGGSYKLIHEAADNGVDCFVTGNFDEPVWHDAVERKINFFALGHAATEKIGIRLLGEKLHREFHLTHTFIDEHNPF